MYLRLVRLRLKDGSLWPFRRYWEENILPALAGADGCLYAALLQATSGAAEVACDSLTLWESAAHADAYVESGLYDELLDGADPFLAAATEWRADLPPLRPGERPPLPDPEVETYPVALARQAPGSAETGAVFLRIVDVRVDPSRFEDAKAAFEASVVPELLATPGCRAAFVLEGLRGRSQALSVTFWDDEASAVRYEASGRFDDFVARMSPYFSGLYQWRLSLAPAGGGRGVTGTDLDVTRYRVLSGRRIRPPAE
jgi:heme-degrading monooxygenase HmoA